MVPGRPAAGAPRLGGPPGRFAERVRRPGEFGPVQSGGSVRVQLVDDCVPAAAGDLPCLGEALNGLEQLAALLLGVLLVAGGEGAGDAVPYMLLEHLDRDR